jgi:hypothetical protein
MHMKKIEELVLVRGANGSHKSVDREVLRLAYCMYLYKLYDTRDQSAWRERLIVYDNWQVCVCSLGSCLNCREEYVICTVPPDQLARPYRAAY